MRVRYDPAADAAYIYLVPEIQRGGVAYSRVPDVSMTNGHVALDFDDGGLLLGIEIVGVSQVVAPDGVCAFEKLDEES